MNEIDLTIIFGSLFFFIFGASIGSFLNVVIFRFEAGKDLSGRSYCPNCKKTLGALDLIPIASYFLLGGKCRYCAKSISSQYPLVELSTALAFTLAFLFFGLNLSVISVLQLVYLLFLVCVLLILSVFDLKKGIIPDKILFPATVLAFFYQLFLTFLGLVSESGVSNQESGNSLFIIPNSSFPAPVVDLLLTLLGTLAIGAFFFGLILVTRGKGMGGGDFKLSIFIGLSLGWPLAVVGVILGFLTGALAAVMLILAGKKGFGQTIPFGPFLALGAFLSALIGNKLLGLYLKTLGL